LTASINSLDGYNHSRRDDLESLGYTFMLLINKEQVPWLNDDNVPINLVKKRQFIAESTV
jgi:hypothetical protein